MTPTTRPCAGTSTTCAARDFWGAAVVPSWYAEATDVLDLDGRVVPVRTVDAGESEAVVGADGFR